MKATAASAAPVIRFFFQDVAPGLKNRTALKAFIAGLFRKEKRVLHSLNYIFCTDAYLLGVNRQYLKHDFFTDIITFDISESPGRMSGEVYISVDRVRENAVTYNSTVQQELHRVVFHGALHLCGYGDKTKEQQLEMRKAEDRYLALYFSR
jgi:rRNA maturation RNase YbeY